MNVNGKDITLSEFEYMYNKNNQQQLSKQPLDKYMDMFTVYKLKVADAEAAGIDTTKNFIREFNGYKNELLNPFLIDTVALEDASKELYRRLKNNVKASHIMISRGNTANEDKAFAAKLDSIRTCILNGQSFEDLALKYSIDRSVQYNKGSMGFIIPGRFPLEFEDACYNTKIGEISPVFPTEYGYHIVKAYETKENEGEVLVEHILKLYPQKANITDAEKATVSAKMDSIYNLVINGANFEDLAKKESEDPGSAKEGGKLDWFGTGKMVPEFEEMSFKLKDGEISKPFATRYGVHIIKKLGSKKMGSYADKHEQMMQQVKAGVRGNVGYDSMIAKLKLKFKYMRNVSVEKQLYSEVSAPNQFDSTFIAKHINDNSTIFTINGVDYPVSLVIESIKNYGRMSGEPAIKSISNKIEEIATNIVIDCERDYVVNNNAEYRNLINEYRDGMLLFEISNQKVWNKGITDSEGLDKFYNEHKSDYKWESPKYKGYLIQTANDSIAKLIKAKINTIGEDSIARTLRKEFKSDVKIERVLVSKGDNAMVDSEVFGGEKIKPEGKYKVYFVAKGKILPQPEELSDVRGLVVSDYQNYLEKIWVKELKSKYPVKINKKTLKKIKE